MPRPKTTKKFVKCLVCAGSTDSANLGLDVCRACTVFYRRSRNRQYVCRSGTERCAIGEGVNCRKCRLNELQRKLDDKPISELLHKASSAHPEEPHSSSSSFEPGTSTSSPSCSQPSVAVRPVQTRPLLARLRAGYRAMCDARLVGELSARDSLTHPIDVLEGRYEILPATFKSIELANRIFLTALLQFGNEVFPEFRSFTREDKWTIVTNFFRRFRSFDAGYRAERAFPQELDKTFSGFTIFFNGQMPANFFEGCPEADAAEAQRVMEAKFKRDYQTGRCHFAETSLRHDEFLAVLALMFWASVDGQPLSAPAQIASKECRDAILSELHAYYRDELSMEAYAARLGQLLMLIQIFEQRSACANEHFEVLRLLNVFREDDLAYRITKDAS